MDKIKKILIAVLLVCLLGFFQGIATAANVYMQILSDPTIQFKVINPNGLVAGYDPATGKIVGQPASLMAIRQ